MRKIRQFLLLFAVVCLLNGSTQAQESNRPLTNKEIVSLIYQLPAHPEKRDEIVEAIRTRGIGFPLTAGLRSLVATKSGNDSLLRRTLEEAERRRVNPTASARPSEAEATDLLERARVATLAAAEAMPDFIVRQLIKRTRAFGNTNNWMPQDNLSIAVSYRANVGEEYKVLSVNGLPLAEEMKEGKDYSKYVGGASSSGVEYISALADLFKPDSRTTFNAVDTDLLNDRRTIVYEFEVQQPYSHLSLTADRDLVANVGSRGRVWIDRETNRVLRFEQIATEIPSDFPIRAASSLIDYDWITISERKYVLPTHSVILITMANRGQLVQSRNEIRYRGYQKFGAELKVIDEIDEKDFPPEKP